MKNFKKALSLLLVLLLILSATGCGQKTADNAENDQAQPVTEAEVSENAGASSETADSAEAETAEEAAASEETTTDTDDAAQTSDGATDVSEGGSGDDAASDGAASSEDSSSVSEAAIEWPVLCDTPDLTIRFTGRYGSDVDGAPFTDVFLIYEVEVENRTDHAVHIKPSVGIGDLSNYGMMMDDQYEAASMTITNLYIERSFLKEAGITDYSNMGETVFLITYYDDADQDNTTVKLDPVTIPAGSMPGSEAKGVLADGSTDGNASSNSATTSFGTPSVNEQVLYDSDLITLYATTLSDHGSQTYLSFRAENKANQNIVLKLSALTVNAWSLDETLQLFAPAGEIAEDELLVTTDDKIEGYAGLATISFLVVPATYTVEDSAKMIDEPLAEGIRVSVTVDNPATVTYPDSGDTLYQADDITLKYQGVSDTSANRLEFRLLAINNSGADGCRL